MEKIIIYQLFARLFGNNNSNRVSNGTLEENGSGKMNDVSVQALKSIKALGATHLWYTGVLEHASQTAYAEAGIAADPKSIVKGVAGSPYAVRDYYDIDPDLAVEVKKRHEEFEALVERTHSVGLKFIMDFVPNHVARIYHSDCAPKGVSDFGSKDDKTVAFSPSNNFYYLPNEPFKPHFPLDNYYEIPAKATGNDCFTASPGITDWYETVKLNYGVDYIHGHSNYFYPLPDTWLRMRDILLYWASKGVDGFRCDMAEMVPVAFWQWAIKEVKRNYPSLIFIAEVYNPDQYRSYLHEGGFDYLYDKVGLYDTLKLVMRNDRPATDITGCWQRIDDIRQQMLNFLENHDEQRIASDFFAGDAIKGRPALLVSTLLSKAPAMIYFGQELGERGMEQEGFSGMDGRTTIFDYWSLESIQRWQSNDRWNGVKLKTKEKALRKFYQKVLTLANSEKALQQGELYDLMWMNYNNPAFDCRHHFAWFRHIEDSVVLCIVNFGIKDADIIVNIGAHAIETVKQPLSEKMVWHDLLTDEESTLEFTDDKMLSIFVPAHNGVLLKLKMN